MDKIRATTYKSYRPRIEPHPPLPNVSVGPQRDESASLAPRVFRGVLIESGVWVPDREDATLLYRQVRGALMPKYTILNDGMN